MKTLAIAVTVGVAVTLLLAFGAMDRLELPVRDAALRALPRRPASSTVIVAIDEASIERLGPWPWPRARLAEIVGRAADAGARGVAFDVLLVDAREGDELLAAALRRVPSVDVAVLAEDGNWRMPAPSLRAAARMGHGNFEFDADGILRRFSSTKQSGARALTALAIEAASLREPVAVAVGQTVAPAFRTRPRDVPQVSAAALLDCGGQAILPVSQDRQDCLSSTLRGKIVFVGLTAVALGDRVLTPVSRNAEAGVTVQAASAEAVLRGETVRDAPPLAGGIVAALFAAAIVRFVLWRRMLATAFLGLVLAGGMLLAMRGIAIPFVTLAGVAVVAITADTAQRLRVTRAAFTAHRVHEAESKRVLAHELKTPLASMRGLSELLGGFELNDAERKRVTALLASEAGKLEAMVGGLLDLERLPLRDFQSSTSVIELGTLVAARVEFLRAGTDRPLIMQPTDSIPVRADAVLVERVVDNLVGNALKYTDGPVTIAVRRNAVEVADRGTGLTPADRERVFQRFFRAASAAGTEGLGLGLALVAEVAKWHGGSATVEANQGGGTLFRVTFGES